MQGKNRKTEYKKQKPGEIVLRVLFERLAATYSRGSYTTTTIGHAMFDGRVRDGNESDHCGNATKLMRAFFGAQNSIIKFQKNDPGVAGDSLKTTHRRTLDLLTIRELKKAISKKEKAIKPHDRLVLVS